MSLNPQSEYVNKPDLLKLLFYLTFDVPLGVHSFSIMTTFHYLMKLSYEVIVVSTDGESAKSQ